MRRLVPRPIRNADLAVFGALARTEVPVSGPLLPRLSRAANHSRLWMVIAALVALLGGRFGRRGRGCGDTKRADHPPDLGELDGRLFVNAASLGSYPDVVATRTRLVQPDDPAFQD